MDNKKTKLSIFIFFMVMFVIGTDTFLISPLLPTLSVIYDIPQSISGWMVSAYAIGYALFALVAGPISDNLDRKKVMCTGLIFFSISTCLCGVATSFPMMIICRLCAGISASFVTPQMWGSIPVLVKPNEIVKAMSYVSAGLFIAQLLGVPIGGYLAALTWHVPFFVIGIAAMLLMFTVIFVLPDIKRPDTQKEKLSIVNIYSTLFKTPNSIKYYLAYLIFQTGTFTAYTFLGTWFTTTFGLSMSGVGTAMMVIGLGNTIGSLFGINITKRIGETKMLLLTIIISAILYCVLPFSPNLMIAEIILFVLFLCGGCLLPILMALMQSLSSTARGTVSALSNATMYAGTSLGGVLSGILFTSLNGFYGVSFFTALVYVIALLIYSSSRIFKYKSIQESIKPVNSNN